MNEEDDSSKKNDATTKQDNEVYTSLGNSFDDEKHDNDAEAAKNKGGAPVPTEVSAAFTGELSEEAKKEETLKVEKEVANESSEQSAAFSETKKKNRKVAVLTICLLVMIGGAILTTLSLGSKKETEPVATIDSLTDEQRGKLGAGPKKEDDNTPKLDDKNNYSDEYKAYLELSDEEKAELEVIPRKEKVPDSVIDDIKEDTDENVVSALPAKFDLRDVINVTVGDQGQYGLCWDYASATSLETYLKLRGIDYNPSELQVDFLSSGLMYGGRKLHEGGYFEFFADMAASIGTISESAFSSLGLNNWYGVNGNDYSYFKLAKNETPLYVTKTVDFPSVYKTAGTADNKTEEELKEFRDLVKAHIMTNGSLYTATSVPFSSNGKLHYCEKGNNEACIANHAMSIIGWDDNYPKENFAVVEGFGLNTSKTPKHDGAYIILNSWGEGWSEVSGESGITYISYDEHDIEAQLSGILSTSLDDGAREIDSIQSGVAKDLVRDELNFYIVEQNGKEYISDYALGKVGYLNLSSRGLTNQDVKDIIEAFPKMTSLDVSDNDITDITPLANLDNSYWINYSKNKIEDISALCSKDIVGYLDISYNKISDISCLEGKLKDGAGLNISGNVGITGFEKLTNLVSLDADEIGLEDLQLISNMHQLLSLSVRNNDIKNLQGLAIKGEMLNYLDLSGNMNLQDLSLDKPVGYLNISDAGLTDITILNNLDVESVSALNNNFGDLSGFNNEKIGYLNLSGNKNLSNFASLKNVNSLSLSNCSIDSLNDLAGLDSVEYLVLTDNEIASFDGAENLANLKYLNLNGNKLTSLEGIEKLEELSDLMVDKNQISSLNGASQLNKLNTISADENEIANADELLGLKNLNFVSLNKNELTSIPNFEEQPDLSLALEGNHLNEVIIPSAVWSINLKDCGIEKIDYESIGALSYVNLEGNPGWDDYRNLTYQSLLGQQENGNWLPFTYISTDYDFSGQRLNELNDAFVDSYLSVRADWNIYLSKYHMTFEKSSEGIVNLEDYPVSRGLFMKLLGRNTSLDGLKIDKSVTKLVLDNDTDSASLDYWGKLGSYDHIYTSGVELNFN